MDIYTQGGTFTLSTVDELAACEDHIQSNKKYM